MAAKSVVANGKDLRHSRANQVPPDLLPPDQSGSSNRCDLARPEVAITFTRFTSKTGKPVGKRMSLVEGGILHKENLAYNLNTATQERVCVADAAGFAKVLDSLTHSQALSYGLAGEDFTTVVTKQQKEAGALGITRTRNDFSWGDGPGVLMVDYDPAPDTEPLDREGLLALLYELLPEAKESAHLWRPSASSCIFKEDGTEVRGIAGQRIYIIVRSAEDIPRAGDVLQARAWLAGHGFYLVSKAGSLLQRGPFDTVVWQPERLDFCGGADCGEGLTQVLPPTVVLGGANPLDTRRALPDLDNAERSRIDILHREARSALQPRQQIAREKYINTHAPDLAKKTGIAVDQASKTLGLAMEGQLMADFVLHPGPGLDVTVGAVLENPGKWHGQGFLDPLEPDYQPNNYRIARLNCYGGIQPFIWSFAHGGRRYRLHRQRQTIRVTAGDLTVICDRTLNILRSADQDLFQRGDGTASELVAVIETHIIPLCHIQLRDRMGRTVRFEKHHGKLKQWIPIDPPHDVAMTISRRRGAWRLRDLKGVITAPTMRPDGSMVTDAGYDEATGLLLINQTGADFCIPDAPDLDTVRRALDFLWKPFRRFPFAGAVDRSVLVSSLLTAAIRRSLPTAPGFLFDASTAGSGKTLLASCVGCLATGRDPYPQPYPEGSGNDDEMRKMLLAALLTSDGVLLLDNIEGTLKSPSLSMLLTKSTYSDRVLSESRRAAVAANVLMLATGNNVVIQGDLNRRLLRCTISPAMERPDLREFEFDPLTQVTQRRVDLVRSALLLIRAYLNSGTKPAPGRMASFETWDRMVRQTVCWLANQFPDFNLTDPLHAIQGGYSNDPETSKLRTLLAAWHNYYRDTPKKLRDVRRDVMSDEAPSEFGTPRPEQRAELLDALLDVAGDRQGVNTRSLSWFVRKFEGRIVDGLSFTRARSDRNNKDQWQVLEQKTANPVTVIPDITVISGPKRMDDGLTVRERMGNNGSNRNGTKISPSC